MSEHEDLWVVVPSGRRADGTWIDETLRQRSLEAGLILRAPEAAEFDRQRVEVVRGPAAWATVEERFRRRGWTDGLPIVPPTTGRVAALVRAGGRQPQRVMGAVPPLGGVATVEKVAANAAMAGCAPCHFPYVLAAVEAVLDPGFGLVGVQTTDENVTPLLVISGPAGALADAEVNAGTATLGPGWRGNATIGRAIRLVMHNIGGGWPGAVSFAGAGQPGRYTLCTAEDDEGCPWPPLRVEQGFGVEDITITAFRAESAVNVTGGLPEVCSVLGSAAMLFTLSHSGSAAILLAPHTARELATAGFSRRDVAEKLAGASTIDEALWHQSWIREATAARPPATDRLEPVSADDLLVFVAGGRIPIPQHVVFPGWGFGERWVTRRVVT